MEVGRSYCEPYLEELAEVREMVVTELAKLAPRLTLPTADGAFYAFVKVDTKMDPMTLVETAGPRAQGRGAAGTTFGMTDACYLRIAYGALQKATVERNGRRRALASLPRPRRADRPSSVELRDHPVRAAQPPGDLPPRFARSFTATAGSSRIISRNASWRAPGKPESLSATIVADRVSSSRSASSPATVPRCEAGEARVAPALAAHASRRRTAEDDEELGSRSPSRATTCPALY
jgi:hypothetical protein